MCARTRGGKTEITTEREREQQSDASFNRKINSIGSMLAMPTIQFNFKSGANFAEGEKF